MKIWKSFLPSNQNLSRISAIRPGSYFVDRRSDPKWSSIYFPQEDGTWLSMGWDYFDIEFKFEIYGISVGDLEDDGNNLVEAGVIDNFSRTEFLLRTEWTRSTKPGEVPKGFEKVIEENGLLSEVPNTAVSAATALHGIIFSNYDEGVAVMIAVDDATSYSLKVSSGFEEVEAMKRGYDLLTLPEVQSWQPPK